MHFFTFNNALSGRFIISSRTPLSFMSKKVLQFLETVTNSSESELKEKLPKNIKSKQIGDPTE